MSIPVAKTRGCPSFYRNCIERWRYQLCELRVSEKWATKQISICYLLLLSKFDTSFLNYFDFFQNWRHVSWREQKKMSHMFEISHTYVLKTALQDLVVKIIVCLSKVTQMNAAESHKLTACGCISWPVALKLWRIWLNPFNSVFLISFRLEICEKKIDFLKGKKKSTPLRNTKILIHTGHTSLKI